MKLAYSLTCATLLLTLTACSGSNNNKKKDSGGGDVDKTAESCSPELQTQLKNFVVHWRGAEKATRSKNVEVAVKHLYSIKDICTDVLSGEYQFDCNMKLDGKLETVRQDAVEERCSTVDGAIGKLDGNDTSEGYQEAPEQKPEQPARRGGECRAPLKKDLNAFIANFEQGEKYKKNKDRVGAVKMVRTMHGQCQQILSKYNESDFGCRMTYKNKTETVSYDSITETCRTISEVYEAIEDGTVEYEY